MPFSSTATIHGDDRLNRVSDVAPPINVSTTFRYDDEHLEPATISTGTHTSDSPMIYSRLGHPNADRLEVVLTEILDGPTVVYASGLAAYHAILIHVNPKRLFQPHCYHGCEAVAKIISRISGMEILPLEDLEDKCQSGDLVHLEDPGNPYGEVVNLDEFAEKIHRAGALMLVDSTLAPPPLRNTWEFGADIVMHSGTKYFGGHSDLLSGIVSVRDEKDAQQLRNDRTYLGTIPASLESYLLLRSLRTMEIRVLKQSSNCTCLVEYLASHKDRYNSVVKDIRHASLQKEEFVKKQLPGGYGPVFSLLLFSQEQCKLLVKNTVLFQHATSLGGAESLIEWRAMSDPFANRNLIRVSVGLENAEDLIEDLAGTLEKIEKGDLTW